MKKMIFYAVYKDKGGEGESDEMRGNLTEGGRSDWTFSAGAVALAILINASVHPSKPRSLISPVISLSRSHSLCNI